MSEVPAGRLPLRSAGGRWLVAASVLGSGMAFLDGTVVNVTLPAIRRDLGGGLAVQQWVVDGYLLTLSALLLLGGALGDRYGRRGVFVVGLVWFAAASVACGLAPGGAALVAARVVQGIGAALLVPTSLALIDALVDPADRGRAIGAWAGLSGVASAAGPLLGGWLVEAASWRWVFFLNVPVAVAAVTIAVRRLPASARPAAAGRLDWLGSGLITVGLSGLVFGLIEAPSRGWSPLAVAALVGGVACLAAFVAVERAVPHAIVPPSMFRNRQFSGANVATLAVYAGLGGAMFLLALQLQESLGYSPLRAGAAMLPVTALMLALSARMGALAQRIGARWPMTVGPLVAAVGLAMLARVTPGAGYLPVVLPALVVFGAGLAVTVAPLTTAVLAAVDAAEAGIASGANNAVARVAGLLAVAVLPLVAGVDPRGGLGPGFGTAMVIAAVVCALGGVVSWFTVRG